MFKMGKMQGVKVGKRFEKGNEKKITINTYMRISFVMESNVLTNGLIALQKLLFKFRN